MSRIALRFVCTRRAPTGELSAKVGDRKRDYAFPDHVRSSTEELDEALQDRGFDTAAAEDAESPQQAMQEFITIENANYDDVFEINLPLYLMNPRDNKESPCMVRDARSRSTQTTETHG